MNPQTTKMKKSLAQTTMRMTKKILTILAPGRTTMRRTTLYLYLARNSFLFSQCLLVSLRRNSTLEMSISSNHATIKLDWFSS